MRDEKALLKMRQKDSDGLRTLMDKYIPYISSIVWGFLHSSMTAEDAEEVVSDVFFTAWNQAEQIDPEKVKAWPGSVARHKAINKLRQIGQTLTLDEDVLELPDGSSFDMLEKEERSQILREAIDSLSTKDRQIFLRHYYYYQTMEAISEEMAISLSTVKTKLRRGKVKLKQSLLRYLT